MSDKTAIEWADATWNPILGCDRVSPGCDDCYAIANARIRESNPHPAVAAAYAGLVKQRDGRIDWTGRVNLLPERLTQPLRWAKGRRIFINGHSDLFHDQVPLEFIARVLSVIALTPQHTYQLLTKRHGRMRSVLTDPCRCGSGHAPSVHLRSAMSWAVSKANPDRIPGVPDDAEHRVYVGTDWPLRNLWVGVSVEDQQRADIRIPALLDTPAAVRWISAEPLLGPVDLTAWMPAGFCRWRCSGCHRFYAGDHQDICPGCGRSGYWCGSHVGNLRPEGQPLGWVVAGGESGPGARPMEWDWARSLRDQCSAAGVAFLMKQAGKVAAGGHGKGSDPAGWPEPFPRQYPTASPTVRTGTPA